MMRRALFVLVPILCLGAASCDLVGPEDFTLPGTYLLTSIDDVALPATIVDEQDVQVEVWGLRLWLEADGTYRSRLEVRILQDGETVLASARSSGDFERDGRFLLLDQGTVEGESSALEILDGRSLREITPLDHELHYERVTSRR